MPALRMTTPSRKWLLVGAVGVTVGVGLLLALLQTAPPPSHGAPQVPAYLEPENGRVQEALADASTQDEFLTALSEAIVEDYPQQDHLWRTANDAFVGTAARQLWDSGRQVKFGNYPPFTVPENPTWAEDPYRDLSWLRDYHSLTWLLIPANAYEETGDARYRDQVKHYLLDWIADNPRGADAPSARSWFDGAVGYRTDLVVHLFRPVLADAISPSELGVLLESLQLHGSVLRGHLFSEGLAGHNHNLFHALSLYNLSAAFPELRRAERWRVTGRERVSTLMPEMVAVDEGVSLEQAASYHLLAIQLFARADAYLRQFDDGLEAAERQTLNRMAAFAALLMTPTQELPAIGDTFYGANGWQRLEAIRDGGISDPFTDFVLTLGQEGTRPPDAAFFPVGGYAILRPQYSSGTAWQRDLQLIVDTSPRERVHGHHDAMNVVLTAFGHALLVDSGGPYAYGSERRAAFVGASAHNVVIVDDGLADTRPVSELVETDSPDHSVVSGMYEVSPGVRHRRTVILLKPDLVVIVDRLEAVDGESHRYRLLYHLPPEAFVDASGSAGIVSAGPAGMGFRVLSSGVGSMRVVSGQEDPPIGWVTERHRDRRAAPVLTAEQTERSAWFVTALSPASADTARVPSVRATELDGATRVVVVRDGQTVVFEIGLDGSVVVSEQAR
jgi:hypothetical protein